MRSKEELQERAQLVRIHEANCQIEHPTADESNFRIAIMKKLGQELGLRELRGLALAGPVIPGQAAATAKPVERKATAKWAR